VADALSTHYAHALAEAVFRPDSGLSPENATAQLRSLEEMLSCSRDLHLALLSPVINKARKIAVLAKLTEGPEFHRLIRNFLFVLVSHRRTQELKPIREQFEHIVDERQGWIRADIASASALSGPQREEIERALGIQLGKFIRAEYTVDRTLLSGIRARVASKEYDASLRGKLEGLRQRLQAESR
jgi:F-type H+-transporting ATPase subunit delta